MNTAARELFIHQLVAALHENTAISGSTALLDSSLQSSSDTAHVFLSSDTAEEGEQSSQEHTGLFLSSHLSAACANNDRLAQDAYMQLQYDFPQAHNASIEALAELYRRLSTEKSMWQQAAEVPITVALLDAVAFLNSQRPCADTSKTKIVHSNEASGLLAASLLLLVFHMCLEMPKDARVDALLSSLVVRHSEQERRCQLIGIEKTMEETIKEERDEFVEKFAAQEDPDDLSEVYDGQLPKPCIHTENQRMVGDTSTASHVDKLQYLALHTFSSSFESVSIEKWKQWRLDDELVAIMKLLVNQKPFSNAGNDSLNAAITTNLYGPQGEWARYLYVLRDRVLRYPNASRDTLWRLKELMEFFHTNSFVVIEASTSHYLIYRVLAEIAISREFQHGTAQRAQQGMTTVVEALIPFIAQDVHQLVTASSVHTRQRNVASEYKHDLLETCAGNSSEDDELAVAVLQLLHFLLFASSNPLTTTERLHESGMLRTLLLLLPSASDTDKDRHAQWQSKRWCPALLRLLGKCMLWHAGFAAYITRVPKFAAMFLALQEQLVIEQLLVALAFHQHGLKLRTTATSITRDMWKVFTSESLFPPQCESFLDAMKKLQDTVFILDCLEKVLAFLRPAMQKELQHNLQQIYSKFNRSFEYPTFAAVGQQQQRQQLNSHSLAEYAHDIDRRKKEEDRSETEALQFTALRNNLRQSVKSMLTALSCGSTMAHTEGRVSSKLD